MFDKQSVLYRKYQNKEIKKNFELGSSYCEAIQFFLLNKANPNIHGLKMLY